MIWHSILYYFRFLTHWYLKVKLISNTFRTKIPQNSHSELDLTQRARQSSWQYELCRQNLSLSSDQYRIHQMVSRIFCNYQSTNFSSNWVCLFTYSLFVYSYVLRMYFNKNNNNKAMFRTAWAELAVKKAHSIAYLLQHISARFALIIHIF